MIRIRNTAPGFLACGAVMLPQSYSFHLKIVSYGYINNKKDFKKHSWKNVDKKIWKLSWNEKTLIFFIESSGKGKKRDQRAKNKRGEGRKAILEAERLHQVGRSVSALWRRSTSHEKRTREHAVIPDGARQGSSSHNIPEINTNWKKLRWQLEDNSWWSRLRNKGGTGGSRCFPDQLMGLGIQLRGSKRRWADSCVWLDVSLISWWDSASSWGVQKEGEQTLVSD